MIIFLIIGLVLGAVSILVALQNSEIITVTFLYWQLSGPLAMILLLSILVGIFITIFLILPDTVRSHFRYRKAMKENARLEEELKRQKELTHFAKQTPPTAEQIAHIEMGAVDSSKSNVI